jgi:hypothetical protein
MQAIERMQKLNCSPNRFSTAADYLERGREMILDRSPTLAEKYDEQARLFREKAQAAQ